MSDKLSVVEELDGLVPALLREMLKVSVKTSASWSVHSLRTLTGMFSGPAAFGGSTLHRDLR